MSVSISKLGQILWNLTPSTTFATTMSQAGWVIMTVESALDECENKFGLFIKGTLEVHLDNYPEELKKAIPWWFDDNFYNREEPNPDYKDYVDYPGASSQTINAAAIRAIDWKTEKGKELQKQAEEDEYYAVDEEAYERIHSEDCASYAEFDWNMIGFMTQLSIVLKAPVAFNFYDDKLEIAFKPTKAIDNPERMLQMIGRKMSAWVEQNTQE